MGTIQRSPSKVGALGQWVAFGLLVVAGGCGPEGPDVRAPGAVTSFTAMAAAGQVALAWTSPTDFDLTGVMIRRATDSAPEGPTAGTQVYDGTDATFTDTGLTGGTTFFYAAFAHDGVPNYAAAAQARATTPPAHPFLARWGSNGSGDGQFYFHNGVAVDASGNVYVADGFNHRIQKFSAAGVFATKWGSNGAGNGQFNDPEGLAVDATGNVYVADAQNHRIQKFTSTGVFVTAWGSRGTADGQLDWPVGIAVDASGNVYVADSQN